MRNLHWFVAAAALGAAGVLSSSASALPRQVLPRFDNVEQARVVCDVFGRCYRVDPYGRRFFVPRGEVYGDGFRRPGFDRPFGGDFGGRPRRGFGDDDGGRDSMPRRGGDDRNDGMGRRDDGDPMKKGNGGQRRRQEGNGQDGNGQDGNRQDGNRQDGNRQNGIGQNGGRGQNNGGRPRFRQDDGGDQ